MMDAPPGGEGQDLPPDQEQPPAGASEDAMGAEPPPMDAPLEPEAKEGAGAGPGLDEPQAAEGTGAITGKYNSSPVGDVKMTKAKGT